MADSAGSAGSIPVRAHQTLLLLAKGESVFKLDTVIFDLDGTIADTRHRQHYLNETPKNWPAFLDGCVNDPPVEPIIQLMTSLIHDYYVVVASGRPDSHMGETFQWFKQHSVIYDRLMMRKAGDYRPDVIVKNEFLEKLQSEGRKVFLAIDDRPSVIKMWRSHGILCLAMDDETWQAVPEGKR